ncbi:molybdopterin molybdotransferase MoeA [Sphingomonas glacialis]|uniref:Molybdopterin molybdenumtransferase n=1 Tax=Sphingomonas glacialis TaxID=658225 RepID=A0A502FYW6_9SPHN|nr:gephyrin-like molybdotransferase Glp [Sphingomonas glacialis]TPG54462.1 molybdopterin molybdenumtransferase MoeA [Sphingomonas glacialis]
MSGAPRPERPSFDAALAIIRERSAPLGRETVGLLDALHRVTAGDVTAASDYPRFDAAAMDGFAFAAADTADATPEQPSRLPIVGSVRAGIHPTAHAPRTTSRISTGAPVPAGCDYVLPHEEARVEQDRLTLDQALAAGRNVRRRGEDAAAGARVLSSGTWVTPEIIGALACYGVATLEVARRPSITLLPTGDELLAQPSADRPAAIFDANSVMITALLRAQGLEPLRAAPVSDDAAQLEHAIAAASDSAIVVTTGGASGGDHDHLGQALARLGATVHFHGVRMRPGKPLLFATLPSGALFFGLPGNPVAALLGARFFVGAALRAMSGLPAERGETVAIETESRPDTTVFLKAVREPGGTIRILADQRSHTLRPLIAANCWVVADATPEGERGRVYPLT